MGDFVETTQNKKIASLNYLLDSAIALTRERNLNKLLDLIMSKVTEALSADRSSLFLIDNEKNEMWSKVAQKSEIKEIRFPVGKGLAGYAAAHKEILNVKDVYKDPRFNKEVDQKTGYKTKNMLCMPIFGHGKEVIGVIQVINKKESDFDKQDEELLTAFNGIAGSAIENSLLLDRIKHISNEIMKMNKELTTLLV